jgi:SAM-dependent methyltransferase
VRDTLPDGMATPSLLTYYQTNNFNPVPIGIEASPAAWESHIAKRVNLYQRHLGVPLGLLAGKSVLEFGCNSGENALVLATFGADLTLVEPNTQVWPRLHVLFEHFGLKQRIKALVPESIETFTSTDSYDVVLAEGFLSTLPTRDALVRKIASLMGRASIGVISFTDRFGSLVELTRRAVLWRACELAGVNVNEGDSLDLAQYLFGADFAKLSTSRSFEAWWRDTLVNPLVVAEYLWSYQELLPQLELANCEFHGSSPAWAVPDHFEWYKNVPLPGQRLEKLADQWWQALPYLLTGRSGCCASEHAARPRDEKVVRSVVDLVEQLSAYTRGSAPAGRVGDYPAHLHAYLQSTGCADLAQFSMELRTLYDAMALTSRKALLDTYHDATYLREVWGAPYHYVSFVKNPASR